MLIDKKRNLTGSLMLLFASIIWGGSFVAQDIALENVHSFTFNATRTLIGFVMLLPLILVFDKLAHRSGEGKKYRPRIDFTRSELIGGLVCGVLLCMAMNLQQTGLAFSSPGKAGFLTALYIVFVPIFNIFFKKIPSPAIIVSVAVAIVGAYLLSVTESFRIGLGDTLLILCGVVYAFQIIAVERFAGKTRGLQLSCVQFTAAGLLSLVLAFLFEEPSITAVLDAALPILYCGVLSTGVGFTLQVIGQARVPSAVASLLMSLESVFALIFSAIILNARLSSRETVGCLLLFTAVIIAQLPTVARSTR